MVGNHVLAKEIRYSCAGASQGFAAVGWVTDRVSDLQNISQQQSEKFFCGRHTGCQTETNGEL